MVSDLTRREVWLQLWDAERLSRYYSIIRDRCYRLDAALSVALIVGSAGILSPMFTPLFEFEWISVWLQPVGAVAVAISAVWHVFARYASKAVTAQSMSSQFRDLADRWLALFIEIDRVTTEEDAVVDQIAELKSRVALVNEKSSLVGLTTNKRLNKRCAIDARQVMEMSFATAGT